MGDQVSGDQHRANTAMHVRRLRKSVGLTQGQLATLLKYKRLTITRWESNSGPGAPSAANIQYLEVMVRLLRELQSIETAP